MLLNELVVVREPHPYIIPSTHYQKINFKVTKLTSGVTNKNS